MFGKLGTQTKCENKNGIFTVYGKLEGDCYISKVPCKQKLINVREKKKSLLHVT